MYRHYFICFCVFFVLFLFTFDIVLFHLCSIIYIHCKCSDITNDFLQGFFCGFFSFFLVAVVGGFWLKVIISLMAESNNHNYLLLVKCGRCFMIYHLGMIQAFFSFDPMRTQTGVLGGANLHANHYTARIGK